MKTFLLSALACTCFVVMPRAAVAQTESLPAIAREVYSRRAEQEIPVVPPRVVRPPVAAVSRLPPAGPAVVVGRGPTWLDALATIRYGYYDDGYVDDNWFYDYYELPSAVAVEAPTNAAPGYRTSWRYDPAAEQRLFRW